MSGAIRAGRALRSLGILSGARARVAAGLLAAALAGCTPSDPVSLFNRGHYEQAFEVFRVRAEAGEPAASNFLGIHYYLGAGVSRDFAKSVEWFERAARDGDPDAQRNLGVMYLRGLGVPQNYHHAWGWLYFAHAGGNASARDYLDVMVDNVTPNASGRAREWAAAQLRARP